MSQVSPCYHSRHDVSTYATAYYGTDVFGLCQWIRHAPSGSKLPEYGSYILKELWQDIAQHYN